MDEGDDSSATTTDPHLLVLISLRSIVQLVCIVNLIYFGEFSDKYSFHKVWENEGPDELKNKIGPPLMTKTPSSGDTLFVRHFGDVSALLKAWKNKGSDELSLLADNDHYELLSESERLTYDKRFYKQMINKYLSWSWRNSIDRNNSTPNTQAMTNVVIVNRHLVIGRYITLLSSLVLSALLSIQYYENFQIWNQYYENYQEWIDYYANQRAWLAFVLFEMFFAKYYTNLAQRLIIARRDQQYDTFLYTGLLSLSLPGSAIAVFLINRAKDNYRLKSKMGGLAYTKYGITGNGVVYHSGCVPLVSGWFFLWILLNTRLPEEINIKTTTTIPIYFTHKMTLAFLGIIGIISVKIKFGSIEDENSTFFNIRRSSSIASFIVVTLTSIAPWIVLCVTVFIENENNSWLPIVFCLALLCQWLLTTIPYYCRSRLCYVNVNILQATNDLIICNYFVISILLYWNTKSIPACILSLIGFAIIMIGNSILEMDRKRPMKLWVTSQLSVHQRSIKYDNTLAANQDSDKQQYHAHDDAVGGKSNNIGDINNNTDNIINDIEPSSNPYYQVYSIGPVLYTTGMFLFGWSLTIVR